MVYPAGGKASHRTHDRHLELANRVNPDEDAASDYFGVKEGISFLVKILPQMDIINDLVIDYMHNCLLGNILDMFL